MLDAGLVIAPEDNRTPYDRFRGRVIFPICDRRGRVVAFGGRALGDGQPKYLNSPETPLFAKGSLLYGQHLAAPAAHKAGRVIAVEGYMDVIALHQAGIAWAVAPLGTALTEQQLELLWRLAEEPVLCFDGDEAGARAAARAVERALPQLNAKRSLRFATLPSGQDPDTMVRDRGRQAMAEIVDAAIPLSDQLWRMALAGPGRSTRRRPAHGSTSCSRTRSRGFPTAILDSATGKISGKGCGCRGKGGGRAARHRSLLPRHRCRQGMRSGPAGGARLRSGSVPCSRPCSISLHWLSSSRRRWPESASRRRVLPQSWPR